VDHPYGVGKGKKKGERRGGERWEGKETRWNTGSPGPRKGRNDRNQPPTSRLPCLFIAYFSFPTLSPPSTSTGGLGVGERKKRGGERGKEGSEGER